MRFPNNTVKQKIETAPLKPGCYIYKDNTNKVIYVGKAVNIRSRTKNYFGNPNNLEPKIQKLVTLIHDVEFVITDSELEALILETNLIKKYRPKYNHIKKDGKMYLWVMLDKDEDFPRFRVVREKKKKNALYFGPYPGSAQFKRILKSLRKIFPYRTCNRRIWVEDTIDDNGKKQTVIKSSDSKPCLYYHLNLCEAPCAGLVAKADYNKNINNLKGFFNSKKGDVVTDLKKDMRKSSDERNYEKAALLRDKVKDLEFISQRVKVDIDTDENKYVVEKKNRQIDALKELLDKLKINGLNLKKNFKIECYDISNIQGSNAVGSMVSFIDGKPNKSLYRKFKIKTKSTPDDFEMMREVFRRRFKHVWNKDSDESFKVWPDLIIVDGGKGQLSATYNVLNEMQLDIPICGLAKRNEELFIINDTDGELKFGKRSTKSGSEVRFLVQRIRDETHRFAINYHRKLRSKSQIASVLDDIPGIGKLTKKRLLQAFGSIDKIRKAKETQLQEIIKNKSTVRNIKKILK